MQTSQSVYENGCWNPPLSSFQHDARNSQIIFTFGDRQLAQEEEIHADLQEFFPNAQILGCSTAGEISGKRIYDEALCATAINFRDTRVAVVSETYTDSLPVTVKALLEKLDTAELQHVLVLSDGQLVNGTELVELMQTLLPRGVSITGGLAGDGTRFSETVVWHNRDACSGKIVICGFYGDAVKIGHGSIGGWVPFGPERVVTSADKNVLHSLDGKPALELYKKYLGDEVKNLPASALLFPLLLKRDGQEDSVIRTILNIDEDNNSMIFAGDIPQGSRVQLMHANFDGLVGGAEEAAELAKALVQPEQANGLVMMVSCVGRRVILGERTEEEIEAVHDIFGEQCAYTGFYSYGEIAPMNTLKSCALHNQTMTITAIFEHQTSDQTSRQTPHQTWPQT